MSETKGPVGEEAPPIVEEPGLAALSAAQQKTTELLAQLGTLLVATSTKGDALALRVAQLERALLALVEVVGQLHGALQQALPLRHS